MFFHKNVLSFQGSIYNIFNENVLGNVETCDFFDKAKNNDKNHEFLN